MKTILITGATSGFGKLTVEKLIDRGHKVIATGRNIETRKVFSQEVSSNKNLTLLNLDLNCETNRSSLKEFLSQTGQIDVLINNAGVGYFSPLEDASDEKIDLTFQTNLINTTKLIRDCIPCLRRTKKSRIINVTSAFGFSGFPLNSIYCATKFGLEGLSHALALELKPYGVSVFTVRPGGFRTNFLENSMSSDKNLSPVYRQQVEGFNKFMDKLRARKNPPNPMKVVNKLVSMCEGKTNYNALVGTDSKMSWFLKRTLPNKVYDVFMNQVTKRIMSLGTSHV